MLIEGHLTDIDGVRLGQVRIEAGLITEVGARLGVPDLVYSDDCLIFAAMGDIHVHARQDATGQHNYKEDFTSAAAAALHGGLHYILDMPNNPKPPIDAASYAEKAELAAAVDSPARVLIYAGIGPKTEPFSSLVPYKAYMGPSVGDLFFTSLQQLDDTLARYRGQVVSFHCEDPELLQQHKGEATHEARRPPVCEVTAIRFALDMIAKHQLRGNICHVSTAAGVDLIRQAKRSGVTVTGEATPHHLAFDVTMITDDNRGPMQMNPPLRTPDDRFAVMEGLRDGALDYLATDHAPHSIEENRRGISGQPHLDTYGAVVTWLHREHRFTAHRLAAVCSANPGMFIGPYLGERIGRIQPGYVGSLTVLNTNHPWTPVREQLRTKSGWSPFEGWVFPGRVEAVVVRGHVVSHATHDPCPTPAADLAACT